MYNIPYDFWRRPIYFFWFNLFRIDIIIELQRLYNQISRLHWSELEKNTIHKELSPMNKSE